MASNKRPRSADVDSHDPRKRAKKQWRTPKTTHSPAPVTIEPGDAGIWVTCAMHKEAKAVTDMRDLLEDYAVKIYGKAAMSIHAVQSQSNELGDERHAEHTAQDTSEHNEQPIEKQETVEADNDGDAPAGDDIETAIALELSTLQRLNQKQPTSKSEKATSFIADPVFRSVKLNTPCLLFFKTRAPIEPVSFVHAICKDAMSRAEAHEPRFGGRFLKRLTPISKVGKANSEGLKAVATGVLEEAFGKRSGLKVGVHVVIRAVGSLR